MRYKPPMQRTSFESQDCPAARALDSVGDWWSILILRDALQGMKRFDEFERSLGIGSNTLTRRLKHLVREGLFERRQYEDHPPRHEYLLTAKGRDFYPVVVALFTWGSRHLPRGEVALRLGDRATGKERRAVVVDERTGERVTPDNTVLMPGPAATAGTRRHIEQIRALQQQQTKS
jgi:DNA-binding HxlR family transcriptional regulator